MVWLAMRTPYFIPKRALWHAIVCAAVSAIVCAAVSASACSDQPTTGLGTPTIVSPKNTIPGTGQLAELEQRRAEWIARRIDDYRFQLRITCFCAGDITRPVLVEVRNGAITKVWDLETGRTVSNTSGYLTITGLFDAAIAELQNPRRGGRVRVTYETTLGIPAFLEVGTLENDAGVAYQLGTLTRL